MINWTYLTTVDQLDEISDLSAVVPCLILKHSSRCSISSVIKNRLESAWDLDDNQMQTYFLDLISYRDVSNKIVERFGIDHESPQVLLIKDRTCIYNESHLGISVSEINEKINTSKNN